LFDYLVSIFFTLTRRHSYC